MLTAGLEDLENFRHELRATRGGGGAAVSEARALREEQDREFEE